ncbi:hypothetical protein BKA70DRAFT_1104746 [Coprinopsis sp. MPI-PUGE-AT-0042]|nr:hypothetical protein BKA70DRAFT_1104746 [Coprinopsis sp. MPI-PUGE-AT-0042]
MNLAALLSKAHCLQGLALQDFLLLIDICRMVRPFLELKTVNLSAPPAVLPHEVETFVCKSLHSLGNSSVQLLWTALKDEVWAVTKGADGVQDVDEALATQYNLHCQSHGSHDPNVLTLTEPASHRASLFTLDRGALPVYTTSLYCRACHRRYYHNYVVHANPAVNSRTYYPGVPDVLQVAEHFFVDVTLLELFANGKMFGWLSSLNCARIYNYSLLQPKGYMYNNRLAFADYVLPPTVAETYDGWQTALKLREEDVLNGFFLYSLLLDHSERDTCLLLKHQIPSHRERLQDELQRRNDRMEGTGQEEYFHACNLCFKVLEQDGELRKIQAAVCDGVAIGHLCCGIHDCKDPLPTNRHRYCEGHDGEHAICVFKGCRALQSPDFLTCTDEQHRSAEVEHKARGKSLFQLQQKAQRVGQAKPQVDATSDCDGKNESGNRAYRAQFRRRRTHNEQFIIRPCGMIVARATFHGSEAISSVYDFAKATFPSSESTPEFFIFDNNCQLDKHLKAIGDLHFAKTGRPVDVFHFNCKHKESDIHCQMYCNPAAFAELIDENGHWVFNTSICEQTNVWLNGFLSILRDMEKTRYNFYLDEMVKRRNRFTLSELASRGCFPWTVPTEAYFPV